MIRKISPILLIVGLALSACAPAVAETPPADSGPAADTPAAATDVPADPTAVPEPDVVVVAINPQFSNAPFFIAIEEGYFAEQNIVIQVENVERSADAIALALAGDLDVFSGALNAGLINAIAGEPDLLRVVTNKGYEPPNSACPSQALYALSELVDNGTFESAEQVRQLVFEGRDNSFATFLTTLWLANDYGLRREDVQFQEIPDEAVIDALNNGAIQAGTAQEPLLSHLIGTGLVKLVKPYGDVVPGLEFSYVAFGRKLLVDNRDLGNRFMTAYLQGVRQLVNEGKSDRNIDLLAEASGFERQVVADMCWTALNPTGEVNFESVEIFMEWANGRGDLERLLTEEEYWDPGFVEYANEQLGAP